MPKFGKSLSGRRHVSTGDGLAFDPFTDLYNVTASRPPQLQNDNDLRIPISPLEKPRLGLESRRQLRAELFGPTPEPPFPESVYTASTSTTPGPTLTRVNTLNAPKSTTPIDIHAAFVILKELKKTATTEELVALHRALLPEIAPQQPPSDTLVRYVETVPPKNAEMRRRRSLFRPGEATRSESEDAAKQIGTTSQSPIVDSRQVNTELHTPPEASRPFTARTATPSDFGRTYLGNYKLGSLHVTNGAASPVPALRSNPARNPSNARSDNDDDYRTASEGLAARRNGVPEIRRIAESSNNSDFQDPSSNLCVDNATTEYVGMHKGIRTSVVYPDRPGVERRPTNETMASTGSKYSRNSRCDIITGQPTKLQHKKDELDTECLQSTRDYCGQARTTNDWVEDVDPQFLECNMGSKSMLSVQENPLHTIEISCHEAQAPQCDLALPRVLPTLCRSTGLLEPPVEDEGAKRDSGYGSEMILHKSIVDSRGPSCFGEPHVQQNKTLKQSNPDYRSPSSDCHITKLLTTSTHPASRQEMLHNPLPLQAETMPGSTLDVSVARNITFAKIPSAEHATADKDVLKPRPSPRKLQKKYPISTRAVSSPIIVQRLRSISECPYLPADVLTQHNQRLSREPGVDHLPRTYKTVAHSDSQESLVDTETFQPIEIRFPSPTPDPEVISRGRKTHRSSSGPLHSASRFFRSRSQNGAGVEDVAVPVESEAFPMDSTAAHISADPDPCETTRAASGEPRRVPSGPRPMVPSSQHLSRSQYSYSEQEINETVAFQPVLTETHNHYNPYEPTCATSEEFDQKQEHKSEQAATEQSTVDPGNPGTKVNRRISMLDRPRGSYYGDWLCSSSTKMNSRNGNPSENGTLSPHFKLNAHGAALAQPDTGAKESESLVRGNAPKTTADFSPSPTRAPPPPPRLSVLRPPKTRPTIRAVESSPERRAKEPTTRTPCTPVHISVSIIKPASMPLSSSLPPKSAPLQSLSVSATGNYKVANVEPKMENKRQLSDKYKWITFDALED